jgi:hypothetical protein
MPESDTLDSQTESPEIVLARWKDRLKTLVDEVKAWVERAGWRTRTIEKPVEDRSLGGTRFLFY